MPNRSSWSTKLRSKCAVPRTLRVGCSGSHQSPVQDPLGTGILVRLLKASEEIGQLNHRICGKTSLASGRCGAVLDMLRVLDDRSCQLPQCGVVGTGCRVVYEPLKPLLGLVGRRFLLAFSKVPCDVVYLSTQRFGYGYAVESNAAVILGCSCVQEVTPKFGDLFVDERPASAPSWTYRLDERRSQCAIL